MILDIPNFHHDVHMCCESLCLNKGGAKGRQVMPFPSDRMLRNKWLKILVLPSVPSQRHGVCLRHFPGTILGQFSDTLYYKFFEFCLNEGFTAVQSMYVVLYIL